MKKILSLLLTFIIILSVILCIQPSMLTAEAAMAPKTALGGYENLCLTYTFRTSRPDYGRHTVEDLLPYVAYIDKEEKMLDYFFDSYLFLPCVDKAPSNNNMHYVPGLATIATDWEAYVNDTFYPNRNVDALNEAFGIAKQTLGGDENKKAGVFFSILYPATESTNFGTLGGRQLDFSKVDDRKYAIKWIIDEQIKRYKEANYENLELVGFYWLEEYVNQSSKEKYYHISRVTDYTLFQYASDYLHSLGYKFIWIPYQGAARYSEWKSLGFDFASYQPNYFWSAPSGNRIVNTCNEASRYGMGMEMEVDGSAAQPEFYKRYLQYLETGMNYGAMNSIKTYYQDGKDAAFYTACYSSNPLYRNIYDLTYKYAKGTLKQSDINYNVSVKDTLPYCAEWVSLDCNYTGCESFVDGNGCDYQQVSGKELTDGIIGESELGTEWHAFHYLTTDADGRMSITIDLGKVYNNLTHFVSQYNNCRTSGIGVPSDIKYYYSENGTDFTLLNNPPLIEERGHAYAYYISDVPVTARYVKLSVKQTVSFPFVFCSEFLIGVGEVSQIEGGENGAPPVTPKPDEGNNNEGSGNMGDGGNNTDTPNPDENENNTENGGNNTEDDENNNGNNTEDGENNNGNNTENGENNNGDNAGNNGNIEGDNSENGGANNDNENGGTNNEQNNPELKYLIGDINGNNRIDGRDYILLRRYYFGTVTFDNFQHKNADINFDGKINARDYILLKRMFFGTYKVN